MLKIVEYKFDGLIEITGIANFAHRFIWIAAAVYISCAAIRLARFNVENEEDESTHMSFIGLPTPAAAGVPASLVLFHQETLPELLLPSSPLYNIISSIIIYSMPLVILGIGVLMVSRIRYPHLVNQQIRGRKPFSHLIKILLALGLLVWNRQVAVMLVFCSFAASGFVKWLLHKAIHKKPITNKAEVASETI